MWIEDLKDGRYKFIERYKDPYTEKDKRVSIILNSKSNQAKKQALSELQDRIDKKTQTSQNRKITFKKCYNEWIAVYKNTVKPSSYKKVVYSQKHISHYINDDYLIDAIDFRLLQKAINNLYYDKNYSFNYVDSIKNHLSLIFAFAEEQGYIQNNPMRKVKIKRKPKTIDDLDKVSNKYLELSEAKALISEMRKSPKSHRNADIVEIMLWTGLRVGELLALKEDNFDGKFLYVRGTLDYTTNKYSDRVIGTTKNEQSMRDVELPKAAIAIIERVLVENQLSGKDTQKFIFTSYSGTPIAIQTINSSLKKNAERAGIRKNVTSHILRHTHISLLAEKNIPIKAIMDRVGHSDIETTMKIYTHVTEKMKADVIEKLNTIDL